MSDITADEWGLLKQYYGDLAYEEPHNHRMFLATIRENKEAKLAAAMAILDRVPDVPPDPGDELR